MAPKSKKQARKTPANRPTVEPVGERTPLTYAPTAPAVSNQPRSFSTEFNPDYSSTIKDLKRILILAGSFFVILIVLAFVLQ